MANPTSAAAAKFVAICLFALRYLKRRPSEGMDSIADSASIIPIDSWRGGSHVHQSAYNSAFKFGRGYRAVASTFHGRRERADHPHGRSSGRAAWPAFYGKRRLADVFRRSLGLALLAAGSDQRLQLQQAGARVAFQDRQSG